MKVYYLQIIWPFNFIAKYKLTVAIFYQIIVPKDCYELYS